MYCASPIVEAVPRGRDNVITWVIEANGVALSDLSGITRVVVDLDGGTNVIDSDTTPSGVIWWTDRQAHRGEIVDVLRLAFGGQGIALGVYKDVVVVVYDATYPNGLQIENEITLNVRASYEP